MGVYVIDTASIRIRKFDSFLYFESDIHTYPAARLDFSRPGLVDMARFPSPRVPNNYPYTGPSREQKTAEPVDTDRYRLRIYCDYLFVEFVAILKLFGTTRGPRFRPLGSIPGNRDVV